MYSRVPECQVTTYYYVGFAYLMMRRYQDAIRVFANILLYIQRTKSMFQRTTYKYEMVRRLLTSWCTCANSFVVNAFQIFAVGVLTVVQWVKDLALLQLRFDPWPWNFCMCRVCPPKTRERKKNCLLFCMFFSRVIS